VQDAVNQRERVDAHLRLHQRVARRWISQLPRLQAQQAHDNLQIVLHPMMHLADEGRFLIEGIAQSSVAILDRGCHVGKGFAQKLELARCALESGANSVVPAAISRRDTPQIADPCRDEPVGRVPRDEPGARDQKDRDREVRANVKTGRPEELGFGHRISDEHRVSD
jgi:hypothetical protein